MGCVVGGDLRPGAYLLDTERSRRSHETQKFLFIAAEGLCWHDCVV